METAEKTTIYLIPGLAADGCIFDRFRFPKDQFEIKILNWFVPDHLHQTIESYAAKMAVQINTKNNMLIGVSFGGVIAQEIASIKSIKHVFIVSSIKSADEIPKLYKWFVKLKAYHLIPFKSIHKWEAFHLKKQNSKHKKKIVAYQQYLPFRNPVYIKWAIKTMIQWQSKTMNTNFTHIHGKLDTVLPIKNINNCIPIQNGTHAMIVNKTSQIQQIIINKIK